MLDHEVADLREEVASPRLLRAEHRGCRRTAFFVAGANEHGEPTIAVVDQVTAERDAGERVVRGNGQLLNSTEPSPTPDS